MGFGARPGSPLRNKVSPVATIEIAAHEGRRFLFYKIKVLQILPYLIDRYPISRPYPSF